jgi:hypothetical protein
MPHSFYTEPGFHVEIYDVMTSTDWAEAGTDACISQDIAGSPAALTNLAVVYTWTDELELAFEKLRALTKVPCGIYHGDLKLDPYWDPLRKDPRFEELLGESAPGD